MSQFFLLEKSGAITGVQFSGDTGSPFTTASVTIYANHAANHCGSTVLVDASSPDLTLQVSDSNSNTIIGTGAGNLSVTGHTNSGYGVGSLSLLAGGIVNTGCGFNSLGRITGGSYNTALGLNAGYNYQGNESSNIVIGNNGVGSESNVIRIGAQGSGTAQQDRTFIAGITGTTPTSGNTPQVTLTDNTGNVTVISSGTSGWVLTSNGSATPSFQASTGGTITFTGDTGTPFSTTSVTIFANNTGNACGKTVLFNASTPDITLQVTDANSNTSIGSGCGTHYTGNNNVVLGANAGTAPFGGQTVVIGDSAFQSASITGAFVNHMVVIGCQALQSGGTSNPDGAVIIGYQAGQNFASPGNAVAIGVGALQAASGNVFDTLSIGGFSGNSLVNGQGNQFFGYQCGRFATTCNFSAYIGSYAGQSIVTDNGSVCIGYSAGQASGGATPTLNVYVGYNAGKTQVTNTECVSIGRDSLNGPTAAKYSVCLGSLTGSSYTSSESSNILLGYNVTGTIGDNNVLRIGLATGTGIGDLARAYIQGIAGATVSAGSPTFGAVVIDTSDGQLLSATTGISSSGFVLTSNGTATAPTWQAVPASSVTFTGDQGTPFSGAAVTIQTGQSTQNSGSSIYFNASTPNIELFVTDSNFNTIIGTSSGNATISGTGNQAYGIANFQGLTSGSDNLAFGFDCATNLLTGSNNLFLGQFSGSAYTTSESNNILIQHAGVILDANVLRIGTQGSGSAQVSTTYVAGIAGASFSAGSPTPASVIIDTNNGQLISSATPFQTPWSDQSLSFNAAGGFGYFGDAIITGTLPTAPPIGTTIQFIVSTGSAFVIQAGVGDFLQVGSTLSGSAGSATSNAVGNCMTLVYNAALSTWFAQTIVGTWEVV